MMKCNMNWQRRRRRFATLNGEIALGLVFNCFLTLTGLSTVYYASHTRRLVHAAWLRWYALLHNFVTLLFFAVLVRDALMPPTAYTEHPMARITRIVVYVQILAAVSYILLTRHQRQHTLLGFVRTLQQLKVHTFNAHRVHHRRTERVNAAASSYLNSLLCVRIFVILVHCVIVIIANWLQFKPSKWLYHMLLCISDLNLMCIGYGVMLPFYIILWSIAHHMNDINGVLSRLPPLAEELRHLYLKHRALMAIIARLCACYKWLIVWTLMYCFANVLTIGYHLILLITEPYTMRTHFLCLGIGVYIVFLADLYVLESLSEFVTTLSEDASLLLKRYAELEPKQLDPSAANCCDWFALHLSWRRVRIAVVYEFPLRRRQLFYIVAQIVMHTIFIVQSDYYNIARNK